MHTFSLLVKHKKLPSHVIVGNSRHILILCTYIAEDSWIWIGLEAGDSYLYPIVINTNKLNFFGRKEDNQFCILQQAYQRI